MRPIDLIMLIPRHRIEAISKDQILGFCRPESSYTDFERLSRACDEDLRLSHIRSKARIDVLADDIDADLLYINRIEIILWIAGMGNLLVSKVIYSMEGLVPALTRLAQAAE